ncbi:conjugal transfer protein TraB [Streptomyces sp. Da 82-17]|uniref:conjugal transfer protein TraB n=1 Tax=Streptomyces sp. Da 82-17 TaxID=3377116 RepID=UPI0038D38DD4
MSWFKPELVRVAKHSPLPAPDPAPKKIGWGDAIFGIINFVSLAARFAALAAAAALLKEGMDFLNRRMRRNAAKGHKLAEMCGQARVDPYFQGLIHEAGSAFDRCAESSDGVARAADEMQAHAAAVKEAHQTEYGGVYEAVNASPYDQPTAGFNEVR